MLEINTKILENASISVDNMAIYLSQHGWKELAGKNDKLVVFQGINDDLGNALLLVLPRQDGSADAVRYLAQALEMVAFLGNQSLEDSLHQIENFSRSYKLFHSQAGHSDVNETRSLLQATRQQVEEFKIDSDPEFSSSSMSLWEVGNRFAAIDSHEEAIESKYGTFKS